MIIQSWDTAIKSGAQHDASACATVLYKDQTHYLLDMQCVRLDYPQLKRHIIAHAARYAPEAVLIEDKASGQSLLQDLRSEHNATPWVAIQPKGDKVMRVARISPIIEAGRVALPTHAPWLDSFEQEISMFPNARHDDQVDALSQYLFWFQQTHLRTTLQMRRL